MLKNTIKTVNSDGLEVEIEVSIEILEEDEYITDFENEFLNKAIDSLPEAQKRRLILHYFCNLNFTQIAKLEKCRKTSIKENVDLAIRNLKKFFEKNF